MRPTHSIVTTLPVSPVRSSQMTNATALAVSPVATPAVSRPPSAGPSSLAACPSVPVSDVAPASTSGVTNDKVRTAAHTRGQTRQERRLMSRCSLRSGRSDSRLAASVPRRDHGKDWWQRKLRPGAKPRPVCWPRGGSLFANPIKELGRARGVASLMRAARRKVMRVKGCRAYAVRRPAPSSRCG